MSGVRYDLCGCGLRKVTRAPRCRQCRWAQPRVLPPIGERFWPKVDRSGGPEACWPWMGPRTAAGYGQYNNRYAHRIALELTEGPIPAGRFACHRCDNPPCVNPRHLYAGTPRDNMLDAMARGRWKAPGPRWPSQRPSFKENRRWELADELELGLV